MLILTLDHFFSDIHCINVIKLKLIVKVYQKSFFNDIWLSPGFQPNDDMLEILRTDFQLRLLWGSRGAAVDQTERYDKFKLILTALSRKLEPPVKHTELWKTRHLYIHIRLSVESGQRASASEKGRSLPECELQ